MAEKRVFELFFVFFSRSPSLAAGLWRAAPRAPFDRVRRTLAVGGGRRKTGAAEALGGVGDERGRTSLKFQRPAGQKESKRG